MPEWFDCARFLTGAKGPVSMRLNAAVERAFIKNGTGVTTRLLVLDKVDAPTSPSLFARMSFASWSILWMPCLLAPAGRLSLNNQLFRLVRRSVW